ncbi:Myotilin [Willisornis vidua]|uniref:Myotilin n=1 Tax=Willisornis vidua TaxID=1566151 RepID=A0ABQ9DMX4_9PASS|nr:Myotilin [Willisornis vidua]
MGRDTFNHSRLLQALFDLALDTSRDWAATASVGTLCQGLPTLTEEKMQSPSGSLTGSAYGSIPVFTKGLQNIRATKGQLVVFECRVHATPTLQVHWYREYDQIRDSADFRILRKRAKELESFAGAAHRPAVPVPLKKPTFPRNSPAGAKDRGALGLPPYSPGSPGLGSRAAATTFGQVNSNNQAEDFHGAYEKSPQASPLCFSQPMYNKQASINSMQKTSDQEIRGTKEALIQDLEKKLRCKDNLLQNGNQRLTYEERMARRLLGPVNAASVLDTQGEDNMQNAQHQNAENVRLQVPTTHVRSRPSSRGDERGHDSIQEKFFQPRFTQVPEDVVIEEGRFCRLDFKVSGLPTPDVMWYQNGRMVHQDQFHKMIVSEKGFHSFIFEAVKSSDAGTYECVAVNRAGEASFTVKVEVIAKEHHTPPTFIFKPQSKKVFEGDTARLECQISAIPTPRIYWKRNNEMVQYNTDRISLLHDNTGRICLLIHNASKKDAGWYTVSAVNGAGVATCHARLEVATHANKPLPAPKQLRVRPTFSKYLALNGRGLDVKQAFSPEGEFQRLAEQSGLYESDEL